MISVSATRWTVYDNDSFFCIVFNFQKLIGYVDNLPFRKGAALFGQSRQVTSNGSNGVVNTAVVVMSTMLLLALMLYSTIFSIEFFSEMRSAKNDFCVTSF